MSRRNNNNSNDNDIVIVSAVRTPLTRSRKGGLASVPPSELLQTVLQATLTRTGVAGTDIQDLCVGNVLQPPAGFAPLRMAALAAGLPASTAMQTINRQCASGLQAIATIANQIRAGEITMGIGAGVESMSQFPMDQMKLPENAVSDWRAMQQIPDAMDCLLPMGITSDTVAVKYGLERHRLDAFAAHSHQKAAAAHDLFRAEIVPVRGVDRDDGVRPTTTPQILSQLKPAFTPTGVTTAGNASQTTDGAAAVLLTTRREARQRQLPILAIWRGMNVSGVPPQIMGIGPAVAIPAVLQQTALTIADIDVFEINEAFASQALYCVEELGIPMDKVNPLGGAIALGHPLGATGARLVTTLVHELRRRPGARFGTSNVCFV